MRYNNYHKHDHVSNIFTPDTNTKPEEYILKSLEYGHTSYFTTNHGSFGDIFEARTLCDKYGIKCIAGIEGYIVPNAAEKDKSNYHIVIIPKTDEARKKMNYVSSMANINGFYYKPRIFMSDLLALDKDDVFITTACVAGLLKDDTSINKIFNPICEHFGNNVYLEVQAHDDPEQVEINEKALKFASLYGLGLIAANDSHYIDSAGQEERLELLRGKKINYGSEDTFVLDFPDGDAMRSRFEKQGVLSSEQIYEAINNTLIFDDCEEIKLDHSIKMPSIYPDLSPEERVALLKKKVSDGFKKTVQEEGISAEDLPKYKEGLRYEMKIIEDTNPEIHTADYFLFNERNVDLAVNKYGGVLTRGGRGSCASFYTNKILGMTQLDRFKIDLPIFPDRFASTARLLENRSLPDIDFNVKEQEPFVAASRELLGEHGCYPMYAPGTMQLSEAFRNVCRSKNIPFEEFNEVAKSIEDYTEAPEWKEILDEANKYVGTIISGSVHPCAHILSDKNLLYEYGVTRLGENVCVLITSSEADEYKVLKNDYLIVKVWKLISETFDEIGTPIIPAYKLLEEIKNDERIWKLFEDGITCTLNQVDSNNGMNQAKRFGLKSFTDGALIAACIRPSFDSWRDKFLNHDAYSTGSRQLDEVLSSTHGYILFQESLMQYFDWLGVTPSESIGLIKKISKKKIKPEDFAKLEERLRHKWIENTGSENGFSTTWEMIQSCMSYGFCVSGKTRLKRNNNGTKYVPTVEEMYNIRNSRQYSVQTGHLDLHKKYLQFGYGTTLSLFDDGYIHENLIEDIHYTGKQKTYTLITETGREIICTADHKFPTPNGIKKLSELTPGSLLYVAGKYQKRDKTYRLTKEFESNAPQKGQMGFQKRPNGQSVIFEKERAAHKVNKDVCEMCGCECDDNFELHHIDQDRTNNQKNNLMWLCNSCHKKIHYQNNRNKRYQKGLVCETEAVAKIIEGEIENVYTVSMKDPVHNYAVESGIITENCSAHAAATSLDMCYGAYLKVNYPLQYYCVCFNNYSDDAERTNKLTKELEYFNIKLAGVKFRHSRAKYAYDEKSKSIYKGISSIKHLNDRAAEDLYALRDKKYASFVDLLADISENCSVDSRQLDILIKINFFSEFGYAESLLEQVRKFDLLHNKKQLSFAKLDTIGIPRFLVEKYSAKVTEKTAKDFDWKQLLTAWIDYAEVPEHNPDQRLKWELELLGYIQTKYPNMNHNYYILIDERGDTSKYFTLYQIKTGETLQIKCRKKVWSSAPVKIGDTIRVNEIKPVKKWKKDEHDNWYQIDETEDVLNDYTVLT